MGKLTADFSMATRAINFGRTYISGYDLDFVTAADIQNNPKTGKTVTITSPPGGSQEARYFGTFYGEPITPYLPTASAIYLIDVNGRNEGFKVYRAVSDFPDINQYVSSSYSSFSAAAAAYSKYVSAVLQWEATVDASPFTKAEFLDAAGLQGVLTIDTPLSGEVNFTTLRSTPWELIGSRFGDTLDGSDANDTIRGGEGNDRLNGYAGTDTAIYPGNKADYAVTFNSDGTVTITGKSGSAISQGTDTLSNMEFGSFDDGTLKLTPTPVTITSEEDPFKSFEGNAAHFRTYTVTRSDNITEQLKVNWTLSFDKSGLGALAAADANDFGQTSGTVTFNSGSDKTSFTVEISGDTKVEPSEYFKIALSQVPGFGAIQQGAQPIYTILNDDWPTVSVRLKSGSDLVVYEGQSATVIVEVSEVAEFPITVSGLFNPAELGSEAKILPVTLPAGQKTVELPFVSADKNFTFDQIDSGEIVASASGGIDPTTGGPKGILVTTAPIKVQIKDELFSPTAQSDFSKGVDIGNKIGQFIGTSTKLGFEVDLLTVQPSVAAKNYMTGLENVAASAELIATSATILPKLAKDLELAKLLGQNNPAAGQEAAYYAYKDAYVNFVTGGIKATLVGVSSAVVAGVLFGVTGVSIGVALPAVALVVVGVGLVYDYDEVIDRVVRPFAEKEFEASWPRPDNTLVLDGYIEGAVVFVDANGNGRWDAGESKDVTNKEGGATLSSSAGTLIASGGLDNLSGLPVEMVLRAPTGSKVVSPLTTLLVELEEQGVAFPQSKLLPALGLPATVDLLQQDPILAAKGGNSAGSATFIRGAEVYATIVGLTRLIPAGAARDAVEDALVAELAKNLANGPFDLTDAAQLQGLLSKAAASANVSVPQNSSARIGAIADANEALAGLITSSYGGDLLASAAEIQADLFPSAPWRLFTTTGFAGKVANDGTIFGTTGFQKIEILPGAGNISLDPSFNRGGDLVRLAGNASEWEIVRSGSSAVITRDDTSVSIPVGTLGLALLFDDGVRGLRFDAAAQSVKIGDQSVGSAPAAILAATDNSTIPTGELAQASSRLFLGESTTISVSGNMQIFGTAAEQRVALSNGQFTFDPSFNRGGDTIRFDAAAKDFTAVQQGSSVKLHSGNIDAVIPIGTAGTELVFAGGDNRELIFDASAGGIRIADQLIGASAVALSNFG